MLEGNERPKKVRTLRKHLSRTYVSTPVYRHTTNARGFRYARPFHASDMQSIPPVVRVVTRWQMVIPSHPLKYGNRDGRAAKHTLKLLTNNSGIPSRVLLVCEDLEYP